MQPYFDPTKKMIPKKMEDDLKFFLENGRQHQKKWKTTSKNGRKPQKKNGR